MKQFLLLLTVCCFTSCEVYHRYFVMASNRYGTAKITVKVTTLHNLPKGGILISNSEMGCNATTNMEQKNKFTTQLAINIDSTRLQYSFHLPPCKTAWLQPSVFGRPAIHYLIIDDRDTISIPCGDITFKSIYSFKKDGRQKFLLTIKAP